MKKIITILTLILSLSAFLNAQDLTSKKGVPILPEQGEWALGIDAAPIFYYLGNMFNGTIGNGVPLFNFTGNYPMTFYGKYMVNAKTAYRLKLQITYNSTTDKMLVPKNAPPATFDPEVKVEDKAKRNNMDLVFGAGLEKRRGKGRLQGIYGAEALVMFGTKKSTFTYGNTWNPNIFHNTADFGDNYYQNNPDYKISELKTGSTFGLDIRGFVGVEYFFAPKISIGGEFGWGVNIATKGEGVTIYEYLDNTTTTPFIDKKTIKYPGGSAFGFCTDNLSGAINLLFYF